MITFLLNILSIVTGQLGRNYDPLFYDVMIYIIWAVIVLLIILVVIVVILKRHKKVSRTMPAFQAKPKEKQAKDETQFWVCPHCGNDTQMKDGRQYCSSCKIYL